VLFCVFKRDNAPKWNVRNGILTIPKVAISQITGFISEVIMNKSIEQNVSNGAHKAIDAASAAVSPSVNGIAATAHQTVDRLVSAASQASQTLYKKGEQLSETLSEKGQQISAAGTRYAERTRDQVRARPIAAIGIAVAAGFAISWLLKKRD
jgi:ElaB/YqjD/DUF883 family membrane-anchored ribosome-binding protein